MEESTTVNGTCLFYYEHNIFEFVSHLKSLKHLCVLIIMKSKDTNKNNIKISKKIKRFSNELKYPVLI